ncbi:MAG: type IV pilin N-terminal domain-containing protein [Halobacteriales archaeon]|nr:type IV pilin N-terminal domain-containing protein [Halobacteriales archaeon]
MPTAPTEAVSPIIGSLLLVAITVVLTASVVVLASSFGGSSSQPAPVVVPSQDEGSDRLVVVRAEPLIPLGRLRIELSVPGHFGYNALASSTTTALPANTLVPLGVTGSVEAGDTLYFCADAAATGVHVLLQDPVTNKLVASDTFASLATCP